METLTQSLITFVIGGILGGIVKSLLDYRNQVFSQLWEKRLDTYAHLWRIMIVFALWPKASGVTYATLYEMSDKMMHWYFEKGGILMSKKTRLVYGNFQKVIHERILEKVQDRNQVITDNEYESIQKYCSSVRTEITKDLLSRKKIL